MTTRQEVIGFLSTLSVEEVEQLLSEVPSIDQGFPGGVRLDSGPIPVYGAIGVAYGVLDADSDEWFDLYLSNAGPNRIECMKLVRELTGMPLQECKNFIDSPLQRPLRKDVHEVEINGIKERFSEIGATIMPRGTSTGRWY